MWEIKVLDSKQHGTTGLITVEVCAVKTEGNNTTHGPRKAYNIDPDTLAAHFGGSLDTWLAWVKGEHQKHHGLHQSMVSQLNDLKGKLL